MESDMIKRLILMRDKGYALSVCPKCGCLIWAKEKKSGRKSKNEGGGTIEKDSKQRTGSCGEGNPGD